MSWPAAVQTLKASFFFFAQENKTKKQTKPPNRETTNKNPSKPHIKNGRLFYNNN